ncbi:hypothetical protein ACSBR1_025600 [Camellia fascicularis]
MKLKFEEAIVVPESERRSIVDSIDFHSIDMPSTLSYKQEKCCAHCHPLLI